MISCLLPNLNFVAAYTRDSTEDTVLFFVLLADITVAGNSPITSDFWYLEILVIYHKMSTILSTVR